jgi:hypothetical protein
MKTFFIIFFILFILYSLQTQKGGADDYSDYPLETTPFREVIDWRVNKERENYDKTLNERFTVKCYTVKYVNTGGKEIADPWYHNEQIKVIYDNRGALMGYAWSMQDMALPIITYKKNNNEDEPSLIYSKTDGFEIISDKEGKKISLISFDTKSINWFTKAIAESMGCTVREYRGIFRYNLPKGYHYGESINKMIDFLNGHFDKLRAASENQTENILFIDIENRLTRFQEIKCLIKQEAREYAGKDWEKRWRHIQKIWPALKDD